MVSHWRCSRPATDFAPEFHWSSTGAGQILPCGRRRFYQSESSIRPTVTLTGTTTRQEVPVLCLLRPVAHLINVAGYPCDEAVLPSIVSACKGTTQVQVEDRTALALRKYKTLNGQAARLILHEKAEILRRSRACRATTSAGARTARWSSRA